MKVMDIRRKKVLILLSNLYGNMTIILGCVYVLTACPHVNITVSYAFSEKSPLFFSFI